MDLYKELVYGLGYAVRPVENMQLFKKLRDSFVEKMNIATGAEKDINAVRKTMMGMSESEINRSRINLITFTNLSSNMIIDSCPGLVETLCGKELFIQRRAHVFFNVPGKKHLSVWNHYEMMSGISPFTYVIWAPLHDLEDHSGTYFIDQKASMEVMKKEQANGLVNGPAILNMMKGKKPVRLKFGQVVVFNAVVLHGTVPFNTNLARIACSTKFQSYNKPLLQKNSDYLKYHKLH